MDDRPGFRSPAPIDNRRETVYLRIPGDETRSDRSETLPNDGNGEYDATADENDRFLDEELIPVLVVGGLVLFLFPEPVTSSLGIVLVSIGIGLWLRELLS